MPPLTPEECAQSRRRFQHDLVSYRELEAWWLPGDRRVSFRQIARLDCRRPHKLPADAVQIGTYAFPFPAGLFMDDLNVAVAGP